MNIRYLGDKGINKEELKSFGGKAAKLHELLAQGFKVPAGFVLQSFEKDLMQHVSTIGGFPVAVRSSCSLEDLGEASFAGLYETFLFIRSEQELHEAIKKCFESKDSDRVRDYLEQKGIVYKLEDLKMTVLVQKMVDAKIAGVLFTLNPTNGFEEECYFEYCEGVGERLVSGHVTPSQCHFDWMKGQVQKHEINLEKTELNEKQIQLLAFESIKIQAYFGAPQDIEWAIDQSGELFILQSRPITTFMMREDFPEVTNADLKDGGISARVCSPCMFSIYREAMRFSMGDYFKKIALIPNDESIEWLYHAYGRAYWNVGAVKEGLKKIPGFREEDIDRDLGIQKEYGEEGPHVTKLSFSGVVNSIPILLGLNREFSEIERIVAQFRESFESRDLNLKSILPELSHLTPEKFRKWLFEVINFQQLTERTYFRTIYNNANYQSEFKGYLKKLKCYRPGDEVDLMGDLEGVAHLYVQSGLRELKRVVDQFGFQSQVYLNAREVFLKTHYHHGPAELDLTVPRWGEKKEWIDDLVRSFFDVQLNSNHLKKTENKYLSVLGFFGQGSFKKQLKRSREFLRVREEMRSFSTRAYFLLRLGILEFAKRYNYSQEDVFMIDLNELMAKMINDEFKIPDLVIRKMRYLGYRNFKAPNEFGGKIKKSKPPMDGALVGLGCSSGEIIGRARVIKDIHETTELTKDDILITLFTDPGWTPVLARVGGVVTEVGGLLSHAAVIGREYGIPAVLNLVDATTRIPDGSLIRINGKTGLVEILEKSS